MTSIVTLSRSIRLDDEDALGHPAILFNDRLSYVAWAATWKSSWHATVSAIRQAKRDRCNKERNDTERSEAQSNSHGLRLLAYNHLQIRKASKIRSSETRMDCIASMKELDSEGNEAKFKPGDRISVLQVPWRGQKGEIVKQYLHDDGGEKFWGNIIVRMDIGQLWGMNCWQVEADVSQEKITT